MSEQNKQNSAINLAPMERVISIAGGVLLIRKGLTVRGLFGLVDIAAGALGVFRGVTGICPAKRRMGSREPTAQLKRLPAPRRLLG
ncbi:hypothetical protein DNK06_21320 [Pseudomonas daroniae]|uniref:DUF2892 domain-containing protein n=1 Tax=Phytopseudomonas daroniae TaxID=2487519 RepID=A0A4Q9QHG9_9GAMM|nr:MULTISPECIES: DUF2892 domain-containing protein [Pseudomonas]TBU72764.1 hypothetical protein DNK06_21320 [Pseudomonas daroniae]TBU77758.1 hypothetical protein DNK31_21410 [Pseudomonas sp. FRB 228]TBU87720.1 hypothetical protein DNJ99_21290 [Pseudomonas daroniae]